MFGDWSTIALTAHKSSILLAVQSCSALLLLDLRIDFKFLPRLSNHGVGVSILLASFVILSNNFLVLVFLTLHVECVFVLV